MGRDLNWYVIPKNIEHDKTKKLCMDWEFQEDEEDVSNGIYAKATGKNPYREFENESIITYLKRKKEEVTIVSDIVYEYLWSGTYDKDWCPKCQMFAKGLFQSSLLIADAHVGHSYSNPYWMSKWSIKDLYMGSSGTPFVNLFRSDSNYREIDSDDVESALETIESLGKPLRKSDIDACEETMEVLAFLKKWTADENVIVIMDDEI